MPGAGARARTSTAAAPGATTGALGVRARTRPGTAAAARVRTAPRARTGPTARRTGLAKTPS